MDKITNINSISVGIGSFMAVVISYALYVVNSIKSTIDNNKKEQEKDFNEFKGQVKEQCGEIKKDFGEAFNRIRDIETIQAVIKTDFDNLKANYYRGKDDK